MFITGEVSGNSFFPCDYFGIVIQAGGGLDWAVCGILACIAALSIGHLNSSASARGRDVGGRLVYVPQAA